VAANIDLFFDSQKGNLKVVGSEDLKI
jgi:hypothetical protein